jgi:quinol monooxygenase YgiN
MTLEHKTALAPDVPRVRAEAIFEDWRKQMSTPYGFIVRLEAKPETAAAVAELLGGALPLAQAEPGTVAWYAARTSHTTFWIFDTFASEDARQAHIGGPIAALLTEKADDLFALAPEILSADVLATK